MGEVARSARGVDRQNASPLRVEDSALVAVRRNLRTKCGYSARSTATLRAGAQTNEIIRARLPFSLFMSEFLWLAVTNIIA